MKKTLHGKRHIRARKIVAVTRRRKRIRKIFQAVKVVGRSAPHIAQMFKDLLSHLRKIKQLGLTNERFD